MKTHVTLVNPPYPSASFLHPPFPSLGLGYIAAVLEKNHFEVDVIDCQTQSFTSEEFRKEICKRKPDVVGITSNILTYKSALKVAKIVKEAQPKCVAVVGGPHVSFWDENALQECPDSRRCYTEGGRVHDARARAKSRSRQEFS